jgi:hypothetical protein
LHGARAGCGCVARAGQAGKRELANNTLLILEKAVDGDLDLWPVSGCCALRPKLNLCLYALISRDNFSGLSHALRKSGRIAAFLQR